jgi:hypothetical protein
MQLHRGAIFSQKDKERVLPGKVYPIIQIRAYNATGGKSIFSCVSVLYTA